MLVAAMTMFTAPKAQAAMDARIKALGLMAAYGAIGGFLLGTASLAFDTPGRSPFVGASLGLYGGIIFGSYIVITHAMKQHQLKNPGAGEDGYYPETPSSPYETPFSGGGYEDPYGGGQQERWDMGKIQINDLKIGFPKDRYLNTPARHQLFYVNLLKYTF